MGMTLNLTSIEERFTSRVNTTTIAVTPPAIVESSKELGQIYLWCKYLFGWQEVEKMGAMKFKGIYNYQKM